MAFERLPDWELRLHRYLASKEDAVFAWGENDCALFAAGGIQAMTGSDPAASFRGRYSTAAGSARALARYGAGSLEATIDALFASVPIAFAQRGDIVMADGAAGICIGGTALFIGEEGERPGLVRMNRSTWQKAWRI